MAASDDAPENPEDVHDWILRRANAGRVTQPAIASPPPEDVFELEAPDTPPFDEDDVELAAAIELSLKEGLDSLRLQRTSSGTDLQQLEEALTQSRIIM